MAHEPITAPGIYPELTPKEYHADPAPQPSLSASVAKTLISSTPLRAWMQQPRLNADYREILELDDAVEESNGAKRFGSVAHTLLLGKGDAIHIIQAKLKTGERAKSYQSPDARAERDAVLAAGAIPCFEHELKAADEVVENVRERLAMIPGCEGAFTGDPLGVEVAGIWQEPGLNRWGRFLVDWWGPTRNDVWDLKTTTDLSDEAIMRKIANEQMDLRIAFYERGIARLLPDTAGRLRYNLVFVERKKPWGVRVVRLDNASRSRGHKKVAYAFHLWNEHMTRQEAGLELPDAWPDYALRIERLGIPGFSEKLWTEREDRPEVKAAINADPFVRSGAHETPHDPETGEITIYGEGYIP